MKPRFFLLGLVLMSFSLLTACKNTVSGFGEDMKRNGEEIRKSVNE